MNTTSASLLERLRQPGEQEAWQRFVHLYTPLLFFWARRSGLAGDEAADLVQDVLVVLVKKLPEFSYDPDRSFRGWLRTIALNKWRERFRQATLPQDEGGLAAVAAPDGSEAFDEVEYRQQLVQQAMQVMQSEFEPTTWKACWEFIVSGRRATEVAAELEVSVDVVYAAKSRVLRRLREELAGLLD
jgi:RNA polymerase sigma-70 factor (ECF subfamily)